MNKDPKASSVINMANPSERNCVPMHISFADPIIKVCHRYLSIIIYLIDGCRLGSFL